ncbi:uncharacterized protein LOC136073914 [Hydra vulgaris]|uniref:uncharacterized protein LOC136073914 n=1 Tax=Hydra vulgaris TaxID=6087 RepID=UPI0032E9BF3B
MSIIRSRSFVISKSSVLLGSSSLFLLKATVADAPSMSSSSYNSPFQPAVKGNVTYTTHYLLDSYGASTIFLPIIMFIEQISITKAFGRKFNYNVKAQNELIAIGMMNIVASFLGVWTELYKWDLLPFVAAFCMSFYKLEYGVMAGTGIAILIMLSREARPKYFCETDEWGKSLTLLLIENLTYPGIDAVNKTIYSEINSCAGIKTLYLDMSTMVRVDFTILKNFEFMKAELSKKEVILEFINFSRDSIKKKYINAGLIQMDGSMPNQDELKINVETSNLSREEISKLKYMKTGINEDDDVEYVESVVENNNNTDEIFPCAVENIPNPEF